MAGLKFPFIREATQSELRDYALEHKLFSPELTAYLTKDWEAGNSTVRAGRQRMAALVSRLKWICGSER